jgi:hypothetical protein
VSRKRRPATPAPTETIEEYRERLRGALGPSADALLADRVILPCSCDWPLCTGWAVIRQSWLDEAKAEGDATGVPVLHGIDLDAEPVPAVD